ncbi:hypothetical protein OHA88_02615 [Streptomyces sp. NBC_00353]|uniref:DUF6197 family protein n=1 Tax=Streptomyces sp. NBC_00353 TaxID=2975722 RepID=UPI002E259F70
MAHGVVLLDLGGVLRLRCAVVDGEDARRPGADGQLAEATAHIPTEPVDPADVITGPLDTGPVPLPDLYPTPVAALLQRAHHRLVTGGWCRGSLVDAEGARCMFGAIRAEARGDAGLEGSAVSVVMDAIRRKFGDVDSVPGFNDAFDRGRTPIRMVDQAAGLADARGL